MSASNLTRQTRSLVVALHNSTLSTYIGSQYSHMRWARLHEAVHDYGHIRSRCLLLPLSSAYLLIALNSEPLYP